MFNTNDILARLQNGEDAETIANELAKTINEANKMYQDQKKKEAEEAAAKEAEKRLNVQKKEEMERILCSLTSWVNKYYDTKLDIGKVSAEDAIELIDSCFDYVNALSDLSQFIGKPRTVKPVKVEIKKGNNPDDTLNNWLKSMGW